MITFAAKGPGENEPFQVDFSNRLLPAETIAGATVTVTVKSGTGDPDPSAMLSGDPSFSATIVQQNLQGGLVGNLYYVLFSVTTNLGHIYEEMCTVPLLSIGVI